MLLNKLSRSKRLCILLVFCCVLLLAGGSALGYLRKTSKSFNWIFPPSDMYTTLASSVINLGLEGKSYSIEFENKYPGLHWLSVRVDNPASVAYGYKGDFVLDLEISSAGNQILKKTINGPGGPFAGKNEHGFELFWYKAPDNLPLRERLVAKITVLRGDPNVPKNYGRTEIAIRKLSDE